MRLAILGSTRGTNLFAIHQAILNKEINASIEMVVSNKKEALILERAALFDLPATFVDPTDLTRDQYDQKISLLLQKNKIELIILMGYMRILSDVFVTTWQNKLINVHPSLLPAFAGKMDLEVHRAVIASKVKETGCTVHYVTKEVDAGPIILQKKCEVENEDTPESLKARVQGLEAEALVEAIQGIFCFT